MKSIKSLKNIKGKIVLMRVDFNLPIKNGKVMDDFRIKKALPSIKLLQSKGAKIILIGHLGKGGETFLPVAKSLNKYIKSKFSSKICNFFGDISYPIYITHYPIIYIYTAWVANTKISISEAYPVTILTFLSAVLLAYICLKLYDIPVRKWITKKLA